MLRTATFCKQCVGIIAREARTQCWSFDSRPRKMASPSAGKRRMDIDVMKLIESKHEVTVLSGLNDLCVKFHGPKDTPYEGGVWKVRVQIPSTYPFKPPAVRFMNKIYHPNIDKIIGTVCLNAITQAWSPLYDLSNIFESFLPQLLAYPNPVDPLNSNAASLFMHKPQEYKKRVQEYVWWYAMGESSREQNHDDSSSSESTMSVSSEDEVPDSEL